MPHDGQPIAALSPVLDGLRDHARAACAPVSAIAARATERLRAEVAPTGRIDPALLEARQAAAHGLAWLATYAESLVQMSAWADRLAEAGTFGEIEALILQIGAGEYLAQVAGGIPMNQGELVRLRDLGATPAEVAALMAEPSVAALLEGGNTPAARARLVALIRAAAGAATYGASGLDDEMEMIRTQFRRFSDEEVAPHAHGWHLADDLIPMETIGAPHSSAAFRQSSTLRYFFKISLGFWIFPQPTHSRLHRYRGSSINTNG
ncbi:MAG: hypothetical protein ACO21B_05105 [Gemmobacter sp.]